MATILDIKSSPKYRQTVLLVDDQAVMLEIHSAMLKSEMPNLSIVTMTDPQKALKWLNTHPVDLVVTDYKMAQMDGVSFVKAIKSSSKGVKPPILVVTALKDEVIHQALISVGAHACLTKPITASQLVEVSRHLLNRTSEYFAA